MGQRRRPALAVGWAAYGVCLVFCMEGAERKEGEFGEHNCNGVGQKGECVCASGAAAVGLLWVVVGGRAVGGARAGQEARVVWGWGRREMGARGERG